MFNWIIQSILDKQYEVNKFVHEWITFTSKRWDILEIRKKLEMPKPYEITKNDYNGDSCAYNYWDTWNGLVKELDELEVVAKFETIQMGHQS